ncbi:MAG: site-specific DNA-methyltransferase [Caulobacteraceae bacterium]|nr:site-specific DNA-methyltransferase [Caulobacteraceae bacterium]
MKNRRRVSQLDSSDGVQPAGAIVSGVPAGLSQFRCEQIGDATLYLGDCREILAAMPDGVADMIFTDPPYGHNNNNGDLIHNRERALGLSPGCELAEARPIANDGAEAATELAQWLFEASPRLLKKGGCCCCCCGGGGPDPQFARWSLMMDGPLDFKQMVVWDKGPMGMGWHYRRSYETVLVGQKKGGACKWHADGDNIENIIRPGYMGIRKIIPQKTEHPTPKPWQLAAHFIRLHTLPGETILDPFNGGGSTAEASIREGRKYIGCELEPRWFDLTCERLRKVEQSPDMFRPVAREEIQEPLL